MRSSRPAAACAATTFVALAFLGAFAATASATSASFTNPEPLAISTGPSGNATPYPSAVQASGLTGFITGVEVRINGFSHTSPQEVGMVLQAPNGDSLLIQNGAGGVDDMTNVTYTLSDGVFPDLPNSAWTAGTYQPTAYFGSDDFPSPGPGTAYTAAAPAGSGSFASTFGGDAPNGTWRLFVRDFVGGDGGGIAGGWRLRISDSNAFAPDNDVFAAAQVVGGATSTTPGNNSLATRQSNEPDHCVVAEAPCSWIGDHSVWYSWTALGSGATSIDTCVGNLDSILAVYTGDAVGSLTRITDNNNSTDCPAGTFGSRVSFDAAAGTNYRIAVGDAGGMREDSFSLRIAGQPAPPAGDSTPPETTIDRGPRARTRNRVARFSVSSTEPGATFTCSLNGRPFNPCSSATTLRARRGRNTFQVVAADAAGNADATPATYRWRVRRRR